MQRTAGPKGYFDSLMRQRETGRESLDSMKKLNAREAVRLVAARKVNGQYGKALDPLLSCEVL